MFAILGIQIVETTHKGALWHIRLPEHLPAQLGITKTRLEATLDRHLSSVRPGTHMLDLGSFLMRHLIETAKSYEFQGITAVVESNKAGSAVYATNLLRWQNDQGHRRRQEYTVYAVSENGRVLTNPEAFSNWLVTPAATGSTVIDKEKNKQWFSLITRAADSRLAEVSNKHLHPENSQWISGAWVR
jgi:hypothetical protein